jgi:hypothetical protein
VALQQVEALGRGVVPDLEVTSGRDEGASVSGRQGDGAPAKVRALRALRRRHNMLCCTLHATNQQGHLLSQVAARHTGQRRAPPLRPAVCAPCRWLTCENSRASA